MFQLVLLYVLFTLLGSPLLANAFHNVTFNSNDTAVVYSPSADWSDWDPAGCLSWPIGKWTMNGAGQITLKFQGVAVYAYGLFDDYTSNPIYNITVDNEAPVRLGDVAIPEARRCDPLFSKTGLAMKNHTIVFQMTNERPADVKDLSFQGFIVTVPDEGDDVSGGNDTGKQKKNPARYIIIGAIAAIVVILGVVIAAIFICCRRRRQQAAAPVSQPAFANPNQFLNSYQPMPSTPAVNGTGAPPPPVPFILPPSREQTPPQNQPPAPWLAQGQPHGHWNPQLQQQPQYPNLTPTPQQLYQQASPWSPAPSNGHTYPSPAPTPFSAQTHETYPSHTSSTPAPLTENYSQYSYPPPSNAPPHMYSNEHSGTQNDMLVSQVAAQVMQQSYDPQETESKQPYYGQAGSSGSVAGTGMQTGHKYTKGGVDHNAAPVVRNENAEIQVAGYHAEAPPPGYVP